MLQPPVQANLKLTNRIVPEEAEIWVSKLVAVWNASRLLEVEQQTQGEGLRLVAELSDGSLLHMVVRQGAVALCALWNGQGGVIWDNSVGFCISWITDDGFYCREWDDFRDFPMKNLIRRNCFLMGAHVESTAAERGEWTESLKKAG